MESYLDTQPFKCFGTTPRLAQSNEATIRSFMRGLCMRTRTNAAVQTIIGQINHGIGLYGHPIILSLLHTVHEPFKTGS